MRKILLFITAASALLAQSSNYPGALDTNSTLFVTADNVQTVLNVAMQATDTVAVVQSSAGFQANMIATICDATTKVSGSVTKCSAWEHMLVTNVSGNVLTVQRGFAGTSVRSHVNGAIISILIDSAHQTSLKSAVIAIETALGPNLSNIPTSPIVNAATYNFSPQHPSGSLVPGSNVVTLSPCPGGVNASSVNAAYLYVAGTGTPEAGLVTGFTSGSGSCQVIVSLANSHSAGWTIQSATAGIQEAEYSMGGPGQVMIPAGKWTIHAPVYIPAPTLAGWQGYSFIGTGRLTSTLTIASDFPLSAQGVFLPQFNAAITFSGPGPIWSDFGVVFPQNYANPLASMTHWPPLIFANGINMGKVNRMYVSGAWQAFVLSGAAQSIGQWEFSDIDISGYGPGVFSFDGAADTIKFNRIHLWPFENGNSPVGEANAIYNPAVIGLKIGQVASLIISDSYFLTGTSIKFSGTGGASAITITNTGFDVFGIIDMSETLNGIQMTINNCFFFQNASAVGFTPPSATIVYGSNTANLIISNSTFVRASTTQPLVSIVGPTASNPAFGQVSFLNNLIYDSSNSASAAPLFNITNTTGGTLRVKISGNQISYENNLTYSNPMLSLTGNGTALTFQNNTNAGWGSGTWLSIANDDQHFISGNVITGPAGAWTVSLPAINTRIHGVYEDSTYVYPKATWTQSFSATTGISGSAGDLLCNATTTQCNFNLPPVGAQPGAYYTAVKTDSSANAVCFVPAGSDKINGSASPYCSSTQWGVIKVKNDGVSNWVKY